jgi:hypothetical protein
MLLRPGGVDGVGFSPTNATVFACARPLPSVFEFVGYEFVSFRSALAIGKGADVYEDFLPTPIGCDEAEAFVIRPFGDTTLVAHGKWV